MKNNILKALFARDDDDEEDLEKIVLEDNLGDEDLPPIAETRPRSLTDAWQQLARQNLRVEKRLVALEETQKELVRVAADVSQTARQQLETLVLMGRFHESAEKRGRQMENAFQGVPDVLRTLPSATREQAEKLSEIAARLYEKAQDNTVNALKSAQASHQRTLEDLIDKSLSASRRLTWWAIMLTFVAVAVVLLRLMSAPA